MLDLANRLIAIPSENPPGNHYEECVGILRDELERLAFDDVRREGACVLASAGTGPGLSTSVVITTLFRRRAVTSSGRGL